MTKKFGLPYHGIHPRPRRPQVDLYIRKSHGKDKLRKLPEPKGVFKSQRVAPVTDWTTHQTDSVSHVDQTQHDNSVGFNKLNAFVGVTNPRYKSEISNGQSATTQASGAEYSYDNAWLTAEGGFFVKSTGDFRYSEGYGFLPLALPNVVDPPASVVTSVGNRAIARFFSALDNAQSSVEAGQDFGEIKETLHGITSPLSTLRSNLVKYFDDLTKRSSRINNYDALRKILADTYLEWTYGWNPLASDIADAYVGLQNKDRHFSLIPIHGKAKQDYSATSSSNHPKSDPFGILNYDRTTKTTNSYKVRYKGMIKTGPEGGSYSEDKVLQFDLPHFVPTAWDLLPYSFVIDYFSNVGDVIRAHSLRTNNVAWCCRTIRTVTLSEFSDHVYPRLPIVGETTTTARGDGGSSYSQLVSFSRTAVDASTLMPTLRFEIPTGKPWLNIAALLAGRTKLLVPFFKK